MLRRRAYLQDSVTGVSLILFALTLFFWFWSQWLVLEVCYAHGNASTDPVTDFYVTFHSNGEVDLEVEDYGKISPLSTPNDWPRPGWHFRKELEFATYSKFDSIAAIAWIDRGRLRAGHWISPGTHSVGTFYLTLPTWAVAIAFAACPLAVMSKRLYLRRRRTAGRCRQCGYDLRATPGRCPECGAVG